MRLRRKRLLVLLSLVASIPVLGLDKDKIKFTPPALSTMTNKVTDNGFIVAALPYDSAALTSQAYGKLNPNEFGVLPVLILFQNDSKRTIKLDRMRVEYIDKDRERIDATPPADVPYLRGPKRPNFNPSPIPGIRLGGKKNPLAAQEIEGRAFAAKMLPPGESAYGFVYFQTSHRSGAKLYITGVQDASTGNDLLYLDIPLD